MSGHRILRVRGLSLRVHRRTVMVSTALVALVIVLAVIALVVPGAGVTGQEAWRALIAPGADFPTTVVWEWRLPRVVTAIVIGGGLAVAGAIFQTLTRNPLGSPDVIGFNTGAYTGAILAMLLGFGGFVPVATGALLGGVTTAVLVYVLSLRRGAAGLRMVVVGLGIGAMLTALNRWLLLTADLDTSMAAATWGAGTLNGLRWGGVVPGATTILVLIVVAWLLSRRLDVLGLGDDAAAGLGLRLGPTRLGLVLVGVGLTASATAVAGPVSFVALAAPHIARRLTRGSRVSGVPVAATGAMLLLAADIVAQRAFEPMQVPVGIITVVIGGVYLISLLARETRR